MHVNERIRPGTRIYPGLMLHPGFRIRMQQGEVLKLLEIGVGVHPIEVSNLVRVGVCRSDLGGTPWNVDYQHLSAREKPCMI